MAAPLWTLRTFEIDVNRTLGRAGVDRRRAGLETEVEAAGIHESGIFLQIVGRGIHIIVTRKGRFARREKEVVPDHVAAARDEIDPLVGPLTMVDGVHVEDVV